MALTNKGDFQEKRRDCIQRLVTIISVRIFQGGSCNASIVQHLGAHGPIATNYYFQ